RALRRLATLENGELDRGVANAREPHGRWYAAVPPRSGTQPPCRARRTPMTSTPHRTMNQNSVHSTTPGLLTRRPVYRGRIVDLSVDTVSFPDGSTGQLEFIRHSGAAAALPILDDLAAPDPRVMLIRQYRYASGGYLLEVPAGRPDQPGEDWEVCARRELEEETGLVAGRLIRLTSILTTPGFCDERIHLFLALDLTTGAASLDRDEFLEPVVLPFSQARASVRAGEVTDAKTVCTLLYSASFVLGGAG